MALWRRKKEEGRNLTQPSSGMSNEKKGQHDSLGGSVEQAIQDLLGLSSSLTHSEQANKERQTKDATSATGGNAVLSYDEFSYFHENALEFGLSYDSSPHVRRHSVRVSDDDCLSALKWGKGDPEIVLLHGGAQNAHTWDTVALALGKNLVAIDLPGHGHSDGTRRHPIDLEEDAIWVIRAMRQLAPNAKTIVGMSLGGLVAMTIAQYAPELVKTLILVDITPGVTDEKAKDIMAFINGPSTFSSFEELLARTLEHNPTRSDSSLRRGILHNALQLPDGTWRWRYARHGGGEQREHAGALADHTSLWDVLAKTPAKVCLVRGLRPQSVVSDEDEAELVKRRKDAHIVRIADAGHSVQGDTPLELAKVIERYLA